MSGCTLCDLPTPDPPLTDPSVPGAFCCPGCLAVAGALEDVERRDLNRDDRGGAQAITGEVAYLAVDGMYCGTCETYLEAVATDQPGVVEASASYATGTMKVTYDPETVDRSGLPTALSGLGYTVREADTNAQSSAVVGRLLVGALFGMMTMLWYVLFCYPTYLGLGPELRLIDLQSSAGRYLGWNLWLMATVVLGYTGQPLLRGAYVSLRARRPNMDLLVTLAATTAFLYSTVVLVRGGTEWYFDVTVVIVLAVTAGTASERRAIRRSAARLTDLIEERVDRARRRVGDGIETVAVDALAGGDEVVVRTGERIPIDGTVVDGTAAVDESLLTGEARPRQVGPGASVVGGGRVTEGQLAVAVADRPTSTLERVLAAVWEVQSTSPGAQRFADRLATIFVPAVLVVAAVATVGHLLTGATPVGALLTGLAVLVVSCPCALGLATPLAVASGTRELLERGIVVSDPATFERVPAIETIAVDKTGTLTTGSMSLTTASDPDVLGRAAAVEQFADHPLARAVTDASPPADAPVTEFTTHPGRGVSAMVGDERVIVGRASLFDDRDWSIPSADRRTYDRARERGQTAALVGWNGAVRGVIAAGDRPRRSWPDALAALDGRVVVLTGDDEAAATPFRDHPAVDAVFAGLPPEGKAAVVDRLRGDGPVAMVGDGTNDAPALATADVGIAMERSALAADAADAVVTTGDLRAIETTMTLAETTNRRIRQNVGWALVYNAVAIPVAVVGLLSPVVAALAMATSSLLVVANSTRSMRTGDADASTARWPTANRADRGDTGTDGVTTGGTDG